MGCDILMKIVFCFDENLATQVQAAAASLLDSRGSDDHFEVHCVCTEGAEIAGMPLEQIIKRRDPASSLVMHCIKNPYEKAYEVRGISSGAYLRLLLHRLLSGVEKVLYLDVEIGRAHV